MAKKKRGRGRPTKCTPALIEKAEKLMAEGHYAVTVANALGIGERTWYDWLSWADDPEKDEIYSQFSQAIARAETEAELEAVRDLRAHAHGKDGVRATVEFLKRRYRDRWSEKTEVEHSGNAEAPIALTADEKLTRLADLLEGAESRKAG